MKTIIYINTDAELRKHGDQTGLDTPVVHAVNYECSKLEEAFSFLANALNVPPGDYDRKIKTQRNRLRFVQTVEHVV